MTVLSVNLHRRHLTTSQASMAAAKAEKLQEKYREAAEKRKQEGRKRGGKARHGSLPDICPASCKSDSRDQLGAVFGVSGKSVDRAKYVMANGIPELAKADNVSPASIDRARQVLTHRPEKS